MDHYTFFTHLRRSGLVSEEQLSQVADRLPVSDRAIEVARALMAEGLLTRFQAEQLLAGRSKGFVLGRYRILDGLSKGGMGFIFKAVHALMGRVVALKVISPDKLQDQHAIDQFQREVHAAAQLSHPNILTVYDADTINGVHFLVMEYIDGPNLDQLVKKEGALPIPLACSIVRQTALALQHAHAKGMVHRDIKPANLVIANCRLRIADSPAQSAIVKVLDFGLARLHSTGVAEPVGTITHEAGALLGTPDYIAPEQAVDVHSADIRSDLYSLGCTFYFALTGRVPFPGSVMQKLVLHYTKEAEPVEKLRPEIPAALADIVRRLMAKDPAQRYARPIELVQALDRLGIKKRESEVKVARATLVTPGNLTQTGGHSSVGRGWVVEEWPPKRMPHVKPKLPPHAEEPSAPAEPPSATPRTRHLPRRWLWLAFGICFVFGALMASLIVSLLLR